MALKGHNIFFQFKTTSFVEQIECGEEFQVLVESSTHIKSSGKEHKGKREERIMVIKNKD